MHVCTSLILDSLHRLLSLQISSSSLMPTESQSRQPTSPPPKGPKRSSCSSHTRYERSDRTLRTGLAVLLGTSLLLGAKGRSLPIQPPCPSMDMRRLRRRGGARGARPRGVDLRWSPGGVERVVPASLLEVKRVSKEPPVGRWGPGPVGQVLSYFKTSKTHTFQPRFLLVFLYVLK